MVEARYRALLDEGTIDPDTDQARAVAELARLQRDLAGYRPAPPKRSLFGRKSTPDAAAPTGVYLHGGVGRGKSMLMDLFHGTVAVERKRRVHFHDFMLDVHARLHERRKAHPKESEPLTPLAAAMADEAWLLCFDEFHVTNIADAMILGRLFEQLFARGVVVVATSNWAPDDLYSGGLQRQLFLPFIDLLKTKVNVVALEGLRDYRLDRLVGRQVYFWPLGPAADKALDETFAALTDGDPGSDDAIMVGGRRLVVPRQAKGVAWFHFDELCARALGAADYLSLATHYHTLLLDGVPRLTPDKRNEARRFITLVDALYERGMHLVCAAEAPPEALYPEGDGAFEFQRTVSRLMEMQSKDYVEQARERAAHPGPFEPFALTSDL
ncbi:MAG: cell division protein ZapE [Pseudomonadota bacterium]